MGIYGNATRLCAARRHNCEAPGQVLLRSCAWNVLNFAVINVALLSTWSYVGFSQCPAETARNRRIWGLSLESTALHVFREYSPSRREGYQSQPPPPRCPYGRLPATAIRNPRSKSRSAHIGEWPFSRHEGLGQGVAKRGHRVYSGCVTVPSGWGEGCGLYGIWWVKFSLVPFPYSNSRA